MAGEETDATTTVGEKQVKGGEGGGQEERTPETATDAGQNVATDGREGKASESEETAKGADEEDGTADALLQPLKELSAGGKHQSKGDQKSGVSNGADDDDDDEEGDVDEPLPLRGLNEGDGTDQVEVLYADASSPPYTSATSFEELGLSVELLQGVYSMKFSKPSKVQAASLPLILAKEPRNLIAQAHNGSGKTACFVLGMLARIDPKRDLPQALCLVPTRELARQIRDVIMNLGKYTGCRVFLAVKQGDEERLQTRLTAITDHIVVGTPGRVMDLLRHRVFNGRHVRILVLDEADEMIDTQGMGDQTLRIKKVLPPDVLTLLFSATYPDHVREFALRVVPHANQIVVKREQLSLEHVKQFYIDCASADGRFQVLSDIYGSLQIGQSIIFVERRRDASELARRMRADGHSVALLHGGDMTPEERDRVIDSFRAGTDRILISTAVLSRGVDVLATTVVINYDLPRDRTGHADAENYLHRVGRTGRFGRKGVAINFVYDARSAALLRQIEAHYGERCRIEPVSSVEQLESILEDKSNFSV